MKVEFNIPDALYRKFKAATIIQEKSEDDVMASLISAYLSELFAVPSSDAANTPGIQQSVYLSADKSVDPFIQKRKFVDWFKTQTYRGRPYNPVTISGYSGRIENACQSSEFVNVSIKNLFEISDVRIFRAVRTEIENCDGFSVFDSASHNGFTAALNMYDRFLCADGQARIKPCSVERAGHRWTYDEDELCVKRFFVTYVIYKKQLTLHDFAEKLHQDLPDISINSLQMKAQNLKYLCEINNLPCSLSSASLAQYSSQCNAAFHAVKELFNK